ncbi:hypothetical protein DENSPDRAFT_901581 [Dentipellis sp. KUC8613]|nr:hypothetical protein DENSPDRAFT_901581 [Dentipellis sp. KUC8613]
MPLAPVDDLGTQLYYEDSGELPGPYTTVVFVHGTAFNGAIFRRMFQYAAEHKLRLVTINRREYPGSTPLSEDELRAAAGTDIEAGRDFFLRRSIEIARFLAWFIQTERIPPICSKDGQRETGGFILLGWSSGWVYVAPLIADAATLPADLVQALEPYFRGLCAFDVPRLLLGMPVFNDADMAIRPYTDALGTIEEYCATFQAMASGHYLHPDVFAWHADGLTEVPKMPLEDVRAIAEAMTVGEKASTLNAFERLDQWLFGAPSEFFLDTTHKVFGKNELTVAQSLWECIMGAWYIQDLHKAREEKGEVGRELLTMFMPERNHFPHWEEPELTCKAVAELFG